jgi:SPP1 gp7 family putative phage head morphogenesis protein|nr:MAG TPA: minor capsid component [Caudoviricetes sp.]
MDDLTSKLSTESLTFEEAVKYFGDKVPISPSQFRKLGSKYQSLAFTVAGYTKLELLNSFHSELLKAIKDGTTMEQFRQNMNDFLERRGYEGVTPFQADNIFRTNIQTAYQVGHYEQMNDPDVKKLRPFWQYDAVNDTHTRPSHLAMDGRVYPADSPVWDTWYPPNGFKCRCTVHSLSRRQVEERGLTVEKDVPDRAELTNGRVVNILPDPRFRTNPAKTQWQPDLSDYPEPLVKAYQKTQRAKKPL